jgi:hypothetical protein
MVAALVTLLLAGGSALPGTITIVRQLALTVDDHAFALLPWQIQAVTAKAEAFFAQPADQWSPAAGAEQVRAYVARAEEIRTLERQLEEQRAIAPADPADMSDAEQALRDLYAQQYAVRSTVEQILEQQVSSILIDAGLDLRETVLPPVQFTFVQTPKKLIVSPRARIETVYGQMIDAEISCTDIERIETTIRQEQQLSAYITGIGGLGAYPTMVVDNASLAWILSTIAHEWVHNYLTFFPLGFTYGSSDENIIINETIAEIVGNEVGAQVLARFYPELVPPSAEESMATPVAQPPAFDFATEMRETRLAVDKLLALGQVAEAEAYMELRRLHFVENGYPLRKLNQAYFAFHGSYGTGAASTSPIGPKLEALRAQTPDLLSFLQTVRHFASAADIDAALAQQSADD